MVLINLWMAPRKVKYSLFVYDFYAGINKISQGIK